MQLPTKTNSAPTYGTWLQGDLEGNSGAVDNGIAGWVNVEAGTPGRWAAIPLGNDKGQLAASQLSETTGAGKVVLSNSPTVNGLTDEGIAHLNKVTISGSCTGCGGPALRTAQAFCAGTAASSSTVAMMNAEAPSAQCATAKVTEDAAQVLMTTNGTISDLAVRCAHTGEVKKAESSASGIFPAERLLMGQSRE